MIILYHYRETRNHPGQNIREPLIVPGKFSREPVNEQRQHETHRAGKEQKYPCDIISRHVKLTEIPSISHQDQRGNPDLQKGKYFLHGFIINVCGSKRDDAAINSFK